MRTMTAKKPSILFYNFGAKFGGAEIVLLKYLEKKSAKIEFRVLLNEVGPFYDKLIENDIPVDVIGTKAEHFYSIKREHAFGFNTFRLLPTAISLFFQVIKYFKMNQFDLIVSNTFKSHLILGFAAKFYGYNGVWRFHDILQRDYKYNQFSRINILLMQFLVPSIKRILSVSQAVTDSFLNYGFEVSKFTVIHNGLDVALPEGQAKAPDSRLIRIGWIGQFAAWKGIKEFIQLCKLMIDAQDQIGKELKFMIAGSALFGNEEYEQEIRAMVGSDYQKYFVFLGHISDTDSFYDSIDVYFHTSIAPDPFPTTILEAGSRGKLVFASNLGGASEIISHGKTGYLINIEAGEETLTQVCDVLAQFDTNRHKGNELQKHIGKHLNAGMYRQAFEASLMDAL